MTGLETSGPTERLGRILIPASVALSVLIAASHGPLQAATAACAGTRLGRVVESPGGMRVVAPELPSLHAGDLLLQLNSHRLRTCADLRAALAEARKQQLAGLLLVRRGHATDGVVVMAPQEVALISPATATPRPPTPVPTPIRQADVQQVRDAVQAMIAFGRRLQAQLPLPASQPVTRQVRELREAYERWRARVPAVNVVEPILGYYETASDILAYRDAAARRAGRLRYRPNVVLEYNSTSRVNGWLRRYPFLRASVIQAAGQVHFITRAERSGRWSPDQAVQLLIEHAIASGEALGARWAPGQEG